MTISKYDRRRAVCHCCLAYTYDSCWRPEQAIRAIK